jgi:hypothetical protein
MLLDLVLFLCSLEDKDKASSITIGEGLRFIILSSFLSTKNWEGGRELDGEDVGGVGRLRN